MEKIQRLDTFINESVNEEHSLLRYGDETVKNLIGQILIDNKNAWLVGVKTAEAYHNEFTESGRRTSDYLGIECMPEYCKAGDTCYLDPAKKGDDSLVCCVVLDVAGPEEYARWISDEFGADAEDAKRVSEQLPLESLVKETLDSNGIDWNKREYRVHHRTGEPIVLKFKGKNTAERLLADTVELVTSYVETRVDGYLSYIRDSKSKKASRMR